MLVLPITRSQVSGLPSKTATLCSTETNEETATSVGSIVCFTPRITPIQVEGLFHILFYKNLIDIFILQEAGANTPVHGWSPRKVGSEQPAARLHAGVQAQADSNCIVVRYPGM